MVDKSRSNGSFYLIKFSLSKVKLGLLARKGNRDCHAGGTLNGPGTRRPAAQDRSRGGHLRVPARSAAADTRRNGCVTRAPAAWLVWPGPKAVTVGSTGTEPARASCSWHWHEPAGTRLAYQDRRGLRPGPGLAKRAGTTRPGALVT